MIPKAEPGHVIDSIQNGEGQNPVGTRPDGPFLGSSSFEGCDRCISFGPVQVWRHQATHHACVVEMSRVMHCLQTDDCLTYWQV